MEISVTLIIIIVTTVVSIGAFNNQRLMNDLIFYPPSIGRGQWYRFFSCGLVHLDPGHLIFNMLALYLFGAGQHRTGVEYSFMAIFGESGKWIYLLMYVLALGACLVPTYAKNKDNYHYSSLGASGAVSAVVFANILINPLAGMGLFFVPIYIAGFLFGIIYLVVSSMLERKGGDNINHSAHIFGAIFGLGFTIVACEFVAHVHILHFFIEQIRQVNPKNIIQFGN